MTPKQIVLAAFSDAKVGHGPAGSYIIVAGTQILGESHGGIGRAWRNAAAAIRERELAKG